MKSNFQLEENKLYVPKKLLVRLAGQLKLKAKKHSNRIGMDAVATYVRHFCNVELEKKNNDLYDNVKAEGIGLSETNVRRALKGKIGTKEKEKANYDVQFELLDLLCYACWQTSLIETIAEPQSDWGTEILYYTVVSDNGWREINEYFNNDLSEFSTDKFANSPKEILTDKEQLQNWKNNFVLFDKAYWDSQEKLPLTDKQRVSYLANLNSSIRLLPRIIAKGFYIPPSEIFSQKGLNKKDIQIRDLFTLKDSIITIVKISDASGQGKSTFCWHIGKVFQPTHSIIYVNEQPLDTKEINFPVLSSNKPILFLIDNCSKKPVSQLINAAKEFYKEKQLIFCLIDQTVRYKDIRDWEEIKDEADEVFEGKIKASVDFTNKIFDLLIDVIKEENEEVEITDKQIYEAKKAFFVDNNLSLVDKIYTVLEYFNAAENVKYKGFAWDVWEDITKDKADVLRNLFLVTSLYYQFGIPVPVKIFNVTDTNEQQQIIEFLSPENSDLAEDYPIILENNINELRLCHESLAKRFFNVQVHKNLSSNLFKEQLKGLSKNRDYIHLLRNIYWLDDFKNSFLIQSFKSPDDFYKRCLVAFEEYYKTLDITIKDDEIIKTQIECAKIYYSFDKKRAFDLLKKIIRENYKTDVHARTLIVSYYTTEKNIVNKKEALQIAKKVLKIEHDNKRLVSKIPYLFMALGNESDFSIIDNLIKLHTSSFISLISLFNITRILKLKINFNYSLDKLFEYLDKQSITSKEENRAWIHLEAVKNSIPEISNNAINQIKYPLVKKFYNGGLYSKCIQLFVYDNQEEIHPVNLIFLISTFLKIEDFNKAQIYIDILKINPKENSKHAAIIKQAKLFYLKKQSISLLKTINSYLNIYGLDDEMVYYIDNLWTTDIYSSKVVYSLIFELKKIIRNFPDLLEARINLIWLFTKLRKKIEIKDNIVYLRDHSDIYQKKYLLGRINKFIEIETDAFVINNLYKIGRSF